MTKTVELSEAQAHLKELLTEALGGIEVVLVENNTPVARLVPISSPGARRVPGLFPGAIWTSEDFDAPLSETFWTADS